MNSLYYFYFYFLINRHFDENATQMQPKKTKQNIIVNCDAMRQSIEKESRDELFIIKRYKNTLNPAKFLFSL